MNKLTIKSGCVEAQFKRGRERTKSLDREKANLTELPLEAEASVEVSIATEHQFGDAPNAETTRKTI